MRLERLEIERQRWSKGEPLVGKIKFAGDLGEIQVTLTDEQINGLLQVVADALVACAKETATKLTATIIEQSGNRLPEPPRAELQ